MDKLPWLYDKYLKDWDIVGMNHYKVLGVRHLFVSMSKDGKCIKEEGRNEVQVFNQLSAKAMLILRDEVFDE